MENNGQLIELVFLEKIQDFVGTNLLRYGPFSNWDKEFIPLENARFLLKAKKAIETQELEKIEQTIKQSKLFFGSDIFSSLRSFWSSQEGRVCTKLEIQKNLEGAGFHPSLAKKIYGLLIEFERINFNHEDGFYRLIKPRDELVQEIKIEKMINELTKERIENVTEILKELSSFEPLKQEMFLLMIAKKIGIGTRPLRKQMKQITSQQLSQIPRSDNSNENRLRLLNIPSKHDFLGFINSALHISFNTKLDALRVNEIKKCGNITGETKNIEFFDTVAFSSYSPKQKRTGSLACVLYSSSGAGKDFVSGEVLKAYPNYKHITRITPSAIDRNFKDVDMDYVIFDFAEEKSLFGISNEDTQQSSMIRQLVSEGLLDLETLDSKLNPMMIKTKGKPSFFLKTTLDIGDAQWHRRVCPKSLDETNIQTVSIVFDTIDDNFGRLCVDEKEAIYTISHNKFTYAVQTGKALEWFDEDEEFRGKVVDTFNKNFEDIDESSIKLILSPVTFFTIPEKFKDIVKKSIIDFLLKDSLSESELDKIFKLFNIDREEHKENFEDEFKNLGKDSQNLLDDIDPNRIIFRTLVPRLITFIQISALKNRYQRKHLVFDEGLSLVPNSYDVVKAFEFMFPYFKGYSFGKLTPSETKILKVIKDNPDNKTFEITEKTDIARPTVNRDVYSLLNKGMVSRDGQKNQGYFYKITEKGEKTLKLFKSKNKGEEFISANIINQEVLEKLKQDLEAVDGSLYVNSKEDENNKFSEFDFSKLKLIEPILPDKDINKNPRNEQLDKPENKNDPLILLANINQSTSSEEKKELEG